MSTSRNFTRRAILVPAALLVAALLSGGCATYQQTSARHLQAFKTGNSAQAIAYYTSNQTGKDQQVCMAEAGRLKLLEGDLAGSRIEYNKVIDQIIDLQEGAMIRLKDVGASALSSTLMDDRMSQYNLPAYEAVFVLQQQALTDIFLGDLDAASVEMRRAVSAQDLVAAKYEKQIAEAKAEAEKPELTNSMQSVDARFATMGPVLGRAKSGFQNPYVWYFSGLMYEVNQDSANAYLAYKKAWELAPENESIQRDLLRLAATENSDQFNEFKAKFPLSDQKPSRSPAEVVVIYEEGLVSQRYSEKIPIFVVSGFHSITFPVYRDGPYQTELVSARWGNEDIGHLMPLCYVQSLAYHDLQLRIRGIAARNISRAITREVAKKAADNINNNYVKIGVKLFAAVSALADEADTRGWYSLPMAVQLLRKAVEPGENIMSLSTHAGKIDVPVTLLPGESKLVWVADLGTRASYCVASLTHADKQPAQFAKTVGAISASPLFLAAGEPCAPPVATPPSATSSPITTPAEPAAVEPIPAGGASPATPPETPSPTEVAHGEAPQSPSHGSVLTGDSGPSLVRPAPAPSTPDGATTGAEAKRAPFTIF